MAEYIKHINNIFDALATADSEITALIIMANQSYPHNEQQITEIEQLRSMIAETIKKQLHKVRQGFENADAGANI